MWTLICHHLEVILKWCRNYQMAPEWEESKNPDIEKRLHSASIRHSRIIWGGFEWRGMRISMERTSFKLHFVQSEVNAALMNDHEWRDDSEMRGYFRIKAEPLILKSFSFHNQSVIPSQNPIVHAIIPFISGSFGHSDVIPKWCHYNAISSV